MVNRNQRVFLLICVLIILQAVYERVLYRTDGVMMMFTSLTSYSTSLIVSILTIILMSFFIFFVVLIEEILVLQRISIQKTGNLIYMLQETGWSEVRL